MSESWKSPARLGASGGLAAVMEAWQREVATALERTAAARSEPSANSDELELAFEELSVASEELHVQNDTLNLAHATIEADRERYRILFHQAPVSYLVTDAHGVIREANAAASDMLGARAERLLDKPLAVFTRDMSRRRLRALLIQIQCGGESATTVLRITPRGDKAFRARVTATAARNAQGQLAEVRWLLVDRTTHATRARQRRDRSEALEALVSQRTEELQRQQELKDRLVANVSHEFRTALAAIGGYCELLSIGARGSLTELQLTDVSRIHSAYEHLAKVVNGLLQFSRLSAGKMAVDLDDISIDDALRGLDDLIRPQADQRSITLRIETPPLPVIAHASADPVRQIVLNLLGNAVKFTKPGGTVELLWRATGAQVEIEVCDTGAGIPADQRDLIFEPFVRLQNDAAAGGTGLGLAISREMAHAMQGELSVSDRPSGGSCFTLRLPLSTRIADVP